MDKRFHVGDRCMLVSGPNQGAWITLLDYYDRAGGWLFDRARPPLMIDGTQYPHSLAASGGEMPVVRECELVSDAERQTLLEAAIDEVLSRHALYPLPPLHIHGSRL